MAVGFEAEEGAEAGLWPTLGLVEMAHRYRRAPQPMGYQGPHGGSKLMIGLIGRGGGDGGGRGVASLTLRYRRIYSIIWDTDAST